jgi:hypothetical protein
MIEGVIISLLSFWAIYFLFKKITQPHNQSSGGCDKCGEKVEKK